MQSPSGNRQELPPPPLIDPSANADRGFSFLPCQLVYLHEPRSRVKHIAETAYPSGDARSAAQGASARWRAIAPESPERPPESPPHPAREGLDQARRSPRGSRRRASRHEAAGMAAIR